mgnify:CR=1 FL=1
MKKGISPLIATIVLIALTVAIGAMIVGWGRSYVQQKSECLGYELNILRGIVDTTNNKVILTVENTGTKTIDSNIDRDRFEFIVDIAGSLVSCKIGSSNICNISFVPFSIRPGDIVNLEISFNSSYLNSMRSGYFRIRGCDRISNDYIKI